MHFQQRLLVLGRVEEGNVVRLNSVPTDPRALTKRSPGLSLSYVAESAFAPYVGFGVLMTSKLGTNAILMRYVVAISLMKYSKS